MSAVSADSAGGYEDLFPCQVHRLLDCPHDIR
jgi:hypothetical protein